MANRMENKIASICQQYAIADLYAFGSRAYEVYQSIRGDCKLPQNKGADVDIGVLPAERKAWSPAKRVQVTMALEELFQTDRVDLVILPEVDPYLALDIIRGELLYTKDRDQQARYELFILRRAADLLPFKKERIRMILEEGAR